MKRSELNASRAALSIDVLIVALFVVGLTGNLITGMIFGEAVAWFVVFLIAAPSALRLYHHHYQKEHHHEEV